MDSEGAVDSTAFDADEGAIGHTGPLSVLTAAVDTGLRGGEERGRWGEGVDSQCE